MLRLSLVFPVGFTTWKFGKVLNTGKSNIQGAICMSHRTNAEELIFQ